MEDERKKNVIISQDSASVVRSTRDEKPRHYTLQIQSFSLLKDAIASSQLERYESQSFNAGGYKWKLALYPDGDVKRNGSDHISLYLVSAEDNILSTTTSEVHVVFTFLVYDNLRDKYLTLQGGVKRFHPIKKEWGFEKLVSLETFNDASNGFLVDDCCAFGVDVFVMKCDDAAKGEVLSLIKQTTYEKYTRKFNNFSQLDSSFYESDPFTVENHSWKIRIYPKGDSSEASGFLSLFLMLDSSKKLPQDVQVYVEFEMAVLSQLGVAPEKITYKRWFSDGVYKGWGTPDFMSLSDLKGTKKGFLQDDTLIVEVKINVISTLKIFV